METKKPYGKAVWVKSETVIDLDSFKRCSSETYDSVIKELVSFRRNHATCTCEPPATPPCPANQDPYKM